MIWIVHLLQKFHFQQSSTSLKNCNKWKASLEYIMLRFVPAAVYVDEADSDSFLLRK